MEARPFRIRDILWGILDNLVHLYPLLVLGGLAIEMPLAAASDFVRPIWLSLLGLEDDWRYPTPFVVLAALYPALVAVAVWNRAQSGSVNLRRILPSFASTTIPLGAWMVVQYTALTILRLVIAQLNGDESTSILLVGLSLIVVWAIVFMPVVPLIVIENLGIFAAVSRSIRLLKLKLPQVVAVALLIGGLSGTAKALLITVAVGESIDQLFDWGYRGDWNLILWAARLLGAIAPPIWALTAVVVYVALRRHEAWLHAKEEEGAEAPSSS